MIIIRHRLDMIVDDQLVLFEVAKLAKRMFTVLTGVWLHPCVLLEVVLDVAGFGENFVAVIEKTFVVEIWLSCPWVLLFKHSIPVRRVARKSSARNLLWLMVLLLLDKAVHVHVLEMDLVGNDHTCVFFLDHRLSNQA